MKQNTNQIFRNDYWVTLTNNIERMDSQLTAGKLVITSQKAVGFIHILLHIISPTISK